MIKYMLSNGKKIPVEVGDHLWMNNNLCFLLHEKIFNELPEEFTFKDFAEKEFTVKVEIPNDLP